jgi:mono/diheme cytochrome c family protein/ketosteroid isomerase-like protein
MNFLKAVLLVIVLAIVAGGLFLVSGMYHVGADAPHWAITTHIIDLLRNRSIEAHAKDVAIPNLDDPKLLSEGAEHYAAMCTGCHLAPGMTDSDLRAGLYPVPPNLSERSTRDAAEAFWVIKHGVKLTAMPAWGKTHDDDAIWGLVAFVRKLPGLTPEQYRQMTGDAGTSEEGRGEHEHGHHHDASAHDGDKSQDNPPHEHEVDSATSEDAAKPHEHERGASSPSEDSASNLRVPKQPAAAVDAFFAALQRGDRVAAERWLDPDVLIFESGGAERSRDDYASVHMGEDIAYLRTARQTVLHRTGDAIGDLAWVASEQRLTKTNQAGAAAPTSTETMVLKRTVDGWRIVHIHWSTAPKA